MLNLKFISQFSSFFSGCSTTNIQRWILRGQDGVGSLFLDIKGSFVLDKAFKNRGWDWELFSEEIQKSLMGLKKIGLRVQTCGLNEASITAGGWLVRQEIWGGHNDWEGPWKPGSKVRSARDITWLETTS